MTDSVLNSANLAKTDLGALGLLGPTGVLSEELLDAKLREVHEEHVALLAKAKAAGLDLGD